MCFARRNKADVALTTATWAVDFELGQRQTTVISVLPTALNLNLSAASTKNMSTPTLRIRQCSLQRAQRLERSPGAPAFPQRAVNCCADASLRVGLNIDKETEEKTSSSAAAIETAVQLLLHHTHAQRTQGSTRRLPFPAPAASLRVRRESPAAPSSAHRPRSAPLRG